VLLDGSLKGLIKQYSNKELKIKYDGEIDNLCEGLKILEKNDNEIRVEIDEEKMNLAESIVEISKIAKIEDLEVNKTSIDNIVARLYKEYKI
jgi:ABC-type uncharacterized transport system ATPase subunit